MEIFHDLNNIINYSDTLVILILYKNSLPFSCSNCQQQTVISCCVFVIALCTFVIGFYTKYNASHLEKWYSIILLVVFISIGVAAFFIILAHEQCEEPQKYKASYIAQYTNTHTGPPFL